jgi:hypothetical protein
MLPDGPIAAGTDSMLVKKRDRAGHQNAPAKTLENARNTFPRLKFALH